MSNPRRRSRQSRHKPHQTASTADNRAPVPKIELFAPNRYDYTIPMEAYRAIQHRFPQQFVCPQQNVEWREDLDYTIHLHGDRVSIQTRAPFQLQKWLEEAGYPAHIKLVPPGPHLATVDAERLNSLINPKWHLPELLGIHFSGQFEVSSSRDVPQFVRALATAFPLAPCVMPFPSSDAAAVFRDKLQQIVDEPVTLMRGLRQRPRSRLVVGTYQAILGANYQHTPLVIVPHWPGSFHQRLKVLARQPDMERLYLIRTQQDSISDNDEAELLHRIGPMIWEFGRYHPRAKHIFHIVDFGGRQRNENPPRGFQLDKRKLYWRHTRRNQFLAILARQLSSEEQAFRSLPADRQHVVVLAEVTEHASKLAALLPGWPVITQDQATSPLPPRCIVTLIAAAACPTLAPLYLVNACGGPPSPWLTSWLEERALAQTAIRLVDLSDGFSAEAASLSQARQAAYKQSRVHWRPLAEPILKPAQVALRNSDP